MVPYFPSKLRIAVIPIVKTLEVKRFNNATIISGFEAELINLLSRKLNFEYEILVPSDSSYGSKDAFGNWTGMVGMLARNEADMAFALMGITEERATVVDFSIPYLPLDKTFLMHYASFWPKTSAFMYPFGKIVWFLFFIVLLLVTVLFRTLISPNDSICSVFIVLWGSCFRQGINYNPRPMTRRIPLGIWLLYSYVITLSYSSVLLSFLTSPVRSKQIRDFKELYVAVRDGEMECRTALLSLEAEYLSKSTIPHLKGLGEYIIKNKWYYTSIKNQSVPKHTAMFGSPFLFRLVFGSPQTYFYSKDAFGYFPFGVAIRKDFCCKKRFNTILLRILSGGLYNKFMDDVFFKMDLKQNLNSDFYRSTSGSALRLSDLNGVFIVLGVGWAVAVSALLMEIAFNRWLCSEPHQT